MAPTNGISRHQGLVALETYPGRRKRVSDGLLDPIQEHHSRSRDHQRRDAAKKKRFHPQPPAPNIKLFIRYGWPRANALIDQGASGSTGS
ncbi:hypothetical protein LPJ38_19565 [Bradyrhizobium daqingense]|uniref:hypothetical protein n=1 Tax=Bradyrhizobium daqingense TaxID=993502 RepID=UPI00142EFDC9|nr:hypothetical protein [Bradyrhizobium daqingense]UFS85896.1 hypothetical protein LPJ38_19565 [Bradyrhizobium daqingense]